MITVRPINWHDVDKGFTWGDPETVLSVVVVAVQSDSPAGPLSSYGAWCPDAHSLSEYMQELYDRIEGRAIVTQFGHLGGDSFLPISAEIKVAGEPSYFVPMGDGARSVGVRAARTVVALIDSDPDSTLESFPLIVTAEEIRTYVR